jgi:hypothetical protein
MILLAKLTKLSDEDVYITSEDEDNIDYGYKHLSKRSTSKKRGDILKSYIDNLKEVKFFIIVSKNIHL